jgi:16S rRNA (cytidine1402-2'-O)-methyltransferase
MLGKLYIVATPIGNLKDITFHAIEILKMVDLILCEDTRVTRRLLEHYQIYKPTVSFHQHSAPAKFKEVIKELTLGKNIALVTDAGTPGISDPGNLLVEKLVAGALPFAVNPIPGPSAVTAVLSISGFPTDKFYFAGFPPHKNKRQKFFKELAARGETVIFYESSHRIKKCLKELGAILNPKAKIVIGRELTKQFESIYRGTIEEILKMDIPEKGEFVIVISKNI